MDEVEAQVTAAHTPLRPLDDWDFQSYEVMLFNVTSMACVDKMQIRVQNIMIIENQNDGSFTSHIFDKASISFRAQTIKNICAPHISFPYHHDIPGSIIQGPNPFLMMAALIPRKTAPPKCHVGHNGAYQRRIRFSEKQ